MTIDFEALARAVAADPELRRKAYDLADDPTLLLKHPAFQDAMLHDDAAGQSASQSQPEA